jgi:hypothetical protein
LGQASAALADAIASALPAVANESLADACDAPAYVLRLPDTYSALQLAEAVALIQSERRDNGRESLIEPAAEYCRVHSFEHYTTRLFEILGLAAT